MKKILKYEIMESITYVNLDGLVTHINQKTHLTRSELIHDARRVGIFEERKKHVVLLMNKFDFPLENISKIYQLRWDIESLYKHRNRTSTPFLLWKQN